MTRGSSQLFVFSQFFFNNEDFNLEAFLGEFEDNLESEQQIAWERFWRSTGEEIILQQWKQKYSDYLSDNTESREQLDSGAVNDDQNTNIAASNSNDAIINQTCSYEDEWSTLWQSHCEQIYLKQYELFSSVFYKYSIDFKQSIELSLAEEEPEEDNTNGRDSPHTQADNIVTDFEQLRLLGLPTGFGCRSARRQKKETNFEEVITDYSSDLCSDSNDCDDDELEVESEDSELIIMSRGKGEKKSQKANLHAIQNKATKAKKKKNDLIARRVPSFIMKDLTLLKYWKKRFSLFSRFNEGIRLDRESWFSVTPENIAKHLAERVTCDIIIDGFCGCGGNAIQFAKNCGRVIAIDIDPAKIEMAKHNATIYGVADKIDFIIGDFLQLFAEGTKLSGDVVFLSPPWGGPKYKNSKVYNIEEYLLPAGAPTLMQLAHNVSENVIMFLPKNSNIDQIIKLAGVGNKCEIEENYLNDKQIALTAFYGKDIMKK